MHRHPPCYHPPSSWSLPQVWLQGGVLDLFGADHFWIYPWNYLCYLLYHQVIIALYLLWTANKVFMSFNSAIGGVSL